MSTDTMARGNNTGRQGGKTVSKKGLLTRQGWFLGLKKHFMTLTVRLGLW
jgi:hypothetical protein